MAANRIPQQLLLGGYGGCPGFRTAGDPQKGVMEEGGLVGGEVAGLLGSNIHTGGE